MLSPTTLPCYHTQHGHVITHHTTMLSPTTPACYHRPHRHVIIHYTTMLSPTTKSIYHPPHRHAITHHMAMLSPTTINTYNLVNETVTNFNEIVKFVPVRSVLPRSVIENWQKSLQFIVGRGIDTSPGDVVTQDPLQETVPLHAWARLFD